VTRDVITLDYIAQEEILRLTAGAGRIFSHPALKITLLRLGAVIEGNICNIKVDQDRLGSINRQLSESIKKAGFELGQSSDMSDELRKVFDKELAFQIFSNKAVSLWSGETIPEELNEFESVIARKINRKLSDLQFLSAMHLAFSQNACNFSVPGAGKTTIVYSAFSFLNHLPIDDLKHIDRILVIGPLASFYAWKREFKECFGREPKYVRLFSGMSAREVDNILLGLSPDSEELELIHVSFQTAVNLEDKLRCFLSSPTKKTMLVVDEAHNIKRENGIWSSACLRLSSNASSRVVLTGTPAPNGYEDLFNLFQFLYPDRNLIGFPRANLVAMSEGVMSSESLRKRIQPFFTRITKQHLGLPPIQEFLQTVDMSSAELKIYRNLEALIFKSGSFGSSQKVTPIQRAGLIRLRQAASNPKMLSKPLEDFYEEDVALSDQQILITDEIMSLVDKFDPLIDSSKLGELIRICKQKIERGEKVLIWSYFISTIDLIEFALSKKLSKKVLRITGKTPSEGNPDSYDESLITREKIITEFIDNPDSMILIANPQALGESVSLHYSCHTAIYFDRDFNCGKFIQSKDRIHRYGLKDVTTNYYYLTYDVTVDWDINDRLTLKERRMNSLLERDEIPLFKTIENESSEFEDIRQVLRSYAKRKLL
jgi:SNF2 family DNA or RNA helicase